MFLKVFPKYKSSLFLLKFLIVVFILAGFLIQTKAQIQNDSTSSIGFGNKGFELRSPQNNHLLQIDLRGQFRIAYPTDSDPISYNDFEGDKVILSLNRARLKLGGYTFKKWFKYYVEY